VRVFVALVLFSSVAHAAPATVAPEELRHDLFDSVVIANAKESWGTGPITIVSVPSENDVRLVMTRAIEPKHVPAALRAWNGRAMTVGIGDSTCTGKITDLHLLAVTETETESGFWDGARKPLPAKGAVLDTWRASDVWLVGTVSDKCVDGRWARAADLKVPPIAEPAAVTTQLRDQALAAFHTLPAYKALQSRFRASGEWEAADGGLAPVFRFDLPGLTLVTHAAYVHKDHFDEQLLAIWELRDGKDLKLRLVATTTALPKQPFGLKLAFDLHRDGHVLFLFETNASRGALYESGGKLVEVAGLRLATP